MRSRLAASTPILLGRAGAEERERRRHPHFRIDEVRTNGTRGDAGSQAHRRNHSAHPHQTIRLPQIAIRSVATLPPITDDIYFAFWPSSATSRTDTLSPSTIRLLMFNGHPITFVQTGADLDKFPVVAAQSRTS